MIKKYLIYIIIISIPLLIIFITKYTNNDNKYTTDINSLHKQKDTLVILADEILNEINNNNTTQQYIIDSLTNNIINQQQLLKNNTIKIPKLKNTTIVDTTSDMIIDSILKENNTNYTKLLHSHYQLMQENINLIEQNDKYAIIIDSLTNIKLTNDTIFINKRIKKKKRNK